VERGHLRQNPSRTTDEVLEYRQRHRQRRILRTPMCANCLADKLLRHEGTILDWGV